MRLNILKRIFFEAIPILLMILLIPFIKNDYLLALIYTIIILASFKIRYITDEYKVFIAGFILMPVFEFVFIKTGVETFQRNSLLGFMPLWLPFLWGYGFVAIRRVSIYIIKLFNLIISLHFLNF